jgi:hypothetical protein
LSELLGKYIKPDEHEYKPGEKIMDEPTIREYASMKFSKITLEHILYGIIFLIGIMLRFVQLGSMALTGPEASLALQAQQLAQGSHPQITPQAGYVIWTSLLFYIFQDSQFFARFWPAVAGCLLILAPYLFRRQLGRRAAMILSLALAIDPGLLAISRQANGNILAIAFVVLATGFILERRVAWAGIFSGLALLSGPSLWQGLLGLGLSLGWSVLVNRRQTTDKELASEEYEFSDPPEKNWPWLAYLSWGVGTILVSGTALLTQPNGLSAMAASLPSFLKGWGTPSGTGLLQFVVALFVYEPLPLILGLWGIGWGLWHKNEVDQFLARLWVVLLVLVLIYPAHQVADLGWTVIPLWALAARQITRLNFDLSEDFLPKILATLLTFILLVFAWMNFIGLFSTPGQALAFTQVHLAGIVAALALIVMIAFLIGWGWSRKAAGNGLFLGFAIMFVVFTIAGSWNSTGLGNHPEAELWLAGPYFSGENLLLQTVRDTSEWNTGRQDTLDLTLVGGNSPALQWSLRNQLNITNEDFLPSGAKPSMVITNEQQKSLSLAAPYSGQAFILEESPTWSLMSPVEWMQWAIYRVAPLEKRAVILWVRTDLFPGMGNPQPGQ